MPGHRLLTEVFWLEATFRGRAWPGRVGASGPHYPSRVERFEKIAECT